MAQYAAQQQLDIDELRMQLVERLRSNAAFSQTVYQEQPIIMTGRQMRSFVPDAIRSARQIARRPELRYADKAAVFYEQARSLAGYEDDFEYAGTFQHYYPTYEDMSNEQLRGYFSWRTQVRRDRVEHSSLSYAYLYLYELINLIGVESAQEGYEAMHAFNASYARLEPSIERYLDAWLDDFVIYYQLDPSLLNTMRFAKQDAAYEVLSNRDLHTDSELFDALCALSSYRISASPFFLEHEGELRSLVTHTYRFIANHHDVKLKTTLVGKLFGRMQQEPYRPFERAVFVDPLKVHYLDYEISPLDTVHCRDGIWWRARYANLEAPCPWLSKLLETAESILRDAYNYPNTLQQPITTKYIVKEIISTAANLVAQERLRQERAVHIDMSKLDHIRTAAEATCDKLIIEEDELECLMSRAAEAEKSNKDTQRCESRGKADSSPRSPMTKNCTLTPQERKLVSALLSGIPMRSFERENACIASVLIDAINEKLYDEFADICIDAGKDEPEIIEDYIDDIKELLAA